MLSDHYVHSTWTVFGHHVGSARMPSPPARPLKPPFEERRARLSRMFVEVVEELLEAGESWQDISVERLINAVDISRSTFYVYFQDKGDLLRAMINDTTADLVVG